MPQLDWTTETALRISEAKERLAKVDTNAEEPDSDRICFAIKVLDELEAAVKEGTPHPFDGTAYLNGAPLQTGAKHRVTPEGPWKEGEALAGETKTVVLGSAFRRHGDCLELLAILADVRRGWRPDEEDDPGERLEARRTELERRLWPELPPQESS